MEEILELSLVSESEEVYPIFITGCSVTVKSVVSVEGWLSACRSAHSKGKKNKKSLK